MTVGVIGTGAIGCPMVEQLLSHGIVLNFYARRQGVIDHLRKLGGTYCSPKMLGETCDVILFILNSFQQCQECAQEVLQTMRAGHIIVHSTIGPEEMTALAQLCNARGVELIAAPVTGGVAGAVNGTLTIMAGGKKASIDAMWPILSAMGTNIIYTGETVASAATMKLLVQLLVGIHTIATAEVLVLGTKSGLDPELIYKTICNSAGVSRIFSNRANTMMERNFSTRGTIDILHKDLKYCVELADNEGCTLPVGQACFNLFQIGLHTLPNTNEDFSAVVKVYEKWANVTVDSSKSHSVDKDN